MDEVVQLAKLQQLHSTARRLPEGGLTAVLFPSFEFQGDGAEQQMDLLLFPHSHSGYLTRLFFQHVLTTGKNWGSHRVCNQNWFAPSRQGIRADQPWITILNAHLRSVA